MAGEKGRWGRDWGEDRGGEEGRGVESGSRESGGRGVGGGGMVKGREKGRQGVSAGETGRDEKQAAGGEEEEEEEGRRGTCVEEDGEMDSRR